MFLQGLHRHGEGKWKEIAAFVQTRTWIQVQSHAQTYFNKIHRPENMDENGHTVAAPNNKSKKRPHCDATTSNDNAAVLVTPTTTIVTKKRKVIPFAIPSRGDTCVGPSEALIHVIVPAQQEATQQKAAPPLTTSFTASPTLSTVSTSKPSSKKRPALAPIRQDRAQLLSESATKKATQNHNLWTQEEDLLLKQYHGQGVTYTEIAKLLTTHTERSCSARAIKLGFGGDRRPRPWTNEEDVLLKQYNEQGLTCKEISKNLPGRSASACTQRLSTTTGASHQPLSSEWTQEEDVLLKQNYEQGLTYPEIAKQLPGRSTDACGRRAKKLGFGGNRCPGRPRDSSNIPWTQAEDVLLKQYYEQDLTYTVIAKHLPGCSTDACGRRAKKLGFGGNRRRRPWTQKEDVLLKQYNEQGLMYKEISKKLPGRSASACAQRLSTTTGASHQPLSSEWKQEEDALLKQYYEQGHDYEEIAKLLTSRSALSCSSRVAALGFSRGHDSLTLSWTKEEDALLMQLHGQGLKYAEIAKLLPRRSAEACAARVCYLGVTRGRSKQAAEDPKNDDE